MPITRRPDQPWHASLTIDLFLTILNNSVFHPFVASLAPLSLAAGGYPLTHHYILNTVYWAIAVCLYHALAPLSDSFAYGPRRTVDHEEEVIVITGGANGLGRCLAESWGMKGATVAVLDQQSAPGEKEEGDEMIDEAAYYQCDISDSDAVRQSWDKINKELGTPTVLVNCAGVVHGRIASELSDEEVAGSFAINTTAQYRLNRLFLQGLQDRGEGPEGQTPSGAGGTIVTVSSVLGQLGAARLSDYAATKAALTAYHRSLAAELRTSHPFVKTILVAPGQLSTEMFSGLEQGSVQRFFGPVVEVGDLAMKIIRMTGEGRGGVIAEPAFARWIGVLELLPVGLQTFVRDLTGLDRAMASFRGRRIGESKSY